MLFMDKSMNFIDHAIVFRAGGYPVAFNSNNNDLTCVEDIEVKTDNQL